MRNDVDRLRALIKGMREAFVRGENAMAYARQVGVGAVNETIATLIAYDLQAGSYIAHARQNQEFNRQWCEQLGHILAPLINTKSTILEVGCGEATTLAGVLGVLGRPSVRERALGFDISWSRVSEGERWLAEQDAEARLFVADLFALPLAENSIDVIYTSHSIEPNGGRESEALAELLRVARRWVVLVEPAYEFASKMGKKRMKEHGYVKGLRENAEQCGGKIVEHRLLEHTFNPLNPSGLLVIEKEPIADDDLESTQWMCPITGTQLVDGGDEFFSSEAGLVYPVLRGIPLLRPEHAIVASAFMRHN